MSKVKRNMLVKTCREKSPCQKIKTKQDGHQSKHTGQKETCWTPVKTYWSKRNMLDASQNILVKRKHAGHQSKHTGQKETSWILVKNTSQNETCWMPVKTYKTKHIGYWKIKQYTGHWSKKRQVTGHNEMLDTG